MTKPDATDDATVAISAGAGELPDRLPVLPGRDLVLFPDMLLPLLVKAPRDLALVDRAVVENRLLVLAPLLGEGQERPGPGDLLDDGCAGVVLKLFKTPEGEARLLVQGLKRVRIGRYLQEEPFLLAEIQGVTETGTEEDETLARARHLREQFVKLVKLQPRFPEEIRLAAENLPHPGRLADLVASNLNLSLEERCAALVETDVGRRLERLSALVERELQLAELGSKIQADVKRQLDRGQREYYLREQLEAIRRELGEADDRQELVELRRALATAGLSEEAAKEARRELQRLERMSPAAAEYPVARTYLDWLLALPWNRSTADRLDVDLARRILDADHHDLAEVKERIGEFLAVRQLNPAGRSPILCFVGPPGVGKTSLGQSIAKALGRAFARISLGGVRDEAEIRGHRRTYVGALPGRIVQGLRRAGSRNPVFMLDELDKLAADYRGDPAAALLEVLDPEQNHAFVDHYLDVAFDLSRVIFIATANQLDPIPPALRDRLEVLQLPGYSEEEKLAIARRHLWPRILRDHGLEGGRLKLTAGTLRRLVRDYTREAGLRDLERQLSSLARKAAVRVAGGKRGAVRVTSDKLADFLGPPRFFGSTARRAEASGVAVGLSWSASGGDVLFIEASRMPGSKGLILTGKLGEVIKESAQAALSWVRAHANELAIAGDFYEHSDLHVHFPEGAIPKDGPSAGLTLVASLISLLIDQPVKPRLAMTGEITLRGKVLPVGGIKQKMLAARRAGIREVILPVDNLPDLEELPPEVRRDLKFRPVADIAAALVLAFPKARFGFEGKTGTKRKNAPARRSKI